LTIIVLARYVTGMAGALFSIAELNSLSAEEFVEQLGSIYEHSPWIAAVTWELRPFSSRRDLHSKLNTVLRAATPEKQLALIQAHPDLAGRLARAGGLTNESTQEQRSAGLDQLSLEEAAEFDQLNAAYRARFSFPFIICARLNDRQAILQAFRERLTHDRGQEIETALAEIHQIAALRLAQIVRE
jgi:2-oxo-4-hydroxy-4-carboxy-5-ureidoimidazoline decarboxylase